MGSGPIVAETTTAVGGDFVFNAFWGYWWVGGSTVAGKCEIGEFGACGDSSLLPIVLRIVVGLQRTNLLAYSV